MHAISSDWSVAQCLQLCEAWHLSALQQLSACIDCSCFESTTVPFMILDGTPAGSAERLTLAHLSLLSLDFLGFSLQHYVPRLTPNLTSNQRVRVQVRVRAPGGGGGFRVRVQVRVRFFWGGGSGSGSGSGSARVPYALQRLPCVLWFSPSSPRISMFSTAVSPRRSRGDARGGGGRKGSLLHILGCKLSHSVVKSVTLFMTLL